MHALIPELAALPPDVRRLVARLLQDDVDLLSVAAVQSRAITAELGNGSAAARESAKCLRAVVAHLIRVKVELLSPIAFEAAGGSTPGLMPDR